MLNKKQYPPRAKRWVPSEKTNGVGLDTNHLFNSHCTKILVGNTIVGAVKDGVFLKRVRGSRHFLKKPPAIALNTDTIEQAFNLGATKIAIHDLESGKFYRATIELIYEKGFKLNRGYGDQLALPISRWEVEQTDQKEQCNQWGAS